MIHFFQSLGRTRIVDYPIVDVGNIDQVPMTNSRVGQSEAILPGIICLPMFIAGLWNAQDFPSCTYDPNHVFLLLPPLCIVQTGIL